jgi:hypothetical protein
MQRSTEPWTASFSSLLPSLIQNPVDAIVGNRWHDGE